MITMGLIVISYYLLGWTLSVRTNKYAWIDFFWSSSFLIVILFSLQQNQSTQHLLLLSMLGLWSIRLSTMLFKRIRSENEDPRYITLKTKLGDKTALGFLGIYLFEAALTIALCIPLYMSVKSFEPGLNAWNIAGLIVFILAIAGETLSDSQLSKFKRENAGKKLVCNIGLWKYSRHPNYFFEIMIWFSYGIYCVGIRNSILGFIPFAIMYLFITKITGIPYSEQQSLKSRGDLYVQYQKTTNKLIPWFPKEN